MKKLLLTLFLILASQVVNADVIKLHYGEPIKGKVTEIAEEYIKYIRTTRAWYGQLDVFL